MTQFAPEEINAAGFYINQSKGGEGLPNNTFTGRGRVTVIDRPPDGHAPVQWMLGNECK